MVDILRKGPAPAASLLDVERSDAVLVLGEDVVNTAPRMGLALRQSILQEAERIAVKTGCASLERPGIPARGRGLERAGLSCRSLGHCTDDMASDVFRGSPADIARVGCGVARELG